MGIVFFYKKSKLITDRLIHHSTVKSHTERAAHKTANISRKSESAKFLCPHSLGLFLIPAFGSFLAVFCSFGGPQANKKKHTRNIEFLFPQRATRCVRAC